jgi:hypothetical protein
MRIQRDQNSVKITIINYSIFKIQIRELKITVGKIIIPKVKWAQSVRRTRQDPLGRQGLGYTRQNLWLNPSSECHHLDMLEEHTDGPYPVGLVNDFPGSARCDVNKSY